MKLKSAFVLNLIIILAFIGLAIISHLLNMKGGATPFFSICAFVFLILLPACSTTD